MPQEKLIRDLLKNVKCIAVLGAKDVPGQPVDMVGRYLIDAGFTVFPVHPVRKNVWGLTTYKTLADIPSVIDLVNVFRAGVQCPAHARECLQLLALPMGFWMQSGIMSPEVHEIFAGSGVRVVENLCIKTEHRKIWGGLGPQMIG